MLSPANQEILQVLKNLHSKRELVGCFNDIPIEVYHHPECPGISSTQIKTVLKRSISHLKHAKEDTEELTFGRLFHAFISEPWTIQNAKSSDVLLAKKMFDNMMKHPVIRALMRGAKHEVTFFSYDQETGLLKKCRADGINDLDAGYSPIVFDFKTTKNASLDSFTSDCKRFNYRLSAAYYLEIISEVYGSRTEDFRLIACEKEEPCEAAIYRVHSRSLEEANNEIRIALNKIKEAIDKGESAWTGYSLNAIDILI